jgi:glycosyltransferase involved in cell wall biosynthesis
MRVSPGITLAAKTWMPLDPPIPIALVMTSFEPGGTERQMIELVRRLDSDRWQVHVACFHARGAWLTRAAERAASVVEFPITSFRHASTVRQAHSFARWCRSRRIRVVQCADLYANVFALPAAATADVEVRLGSRRDINPGKTLGQIAMQRAAYTCAHRVVANSRAASDRLRSEGVPQRRISIIPNGLDLAMFSERGTRSPLRPRRRVLMVANLRPEKGHDTLIDAASIVLQAYADARFDIVGGGPQRDRLIALAEARGVAPAFSWLGHREDVAALAMAADIFVLPSRSEAFPNALLEAMASGLPAVASRVGGIPELIADEQTGLLVRPGDAAGLADAICRLMSDSGLAARLGAAARDHVESRYSFDRMTAAFAALYDAELAQRSAAARRPMAS